MKKVLALLLLVILLGTNSAVAQQADRLIITPYYSHTFSIFAGLEINGGVATCSGSVTGRYGYTFTTAKVTLQKREVGSEDWEYVDSCSKTAAGRFTAQVEETKSVSSTYDYRVYVKGTITDSEGVILETTSKYSAIVRY